MTAVIFDLGNVIINFDWQIAIDSIATETKVQPQDLLRELFYSGVEMDFERGRYSVDELHREMETRLKTNVCKQNMIDAACSIFSRNEMMEDLTRQVKSRGHRVVLLSNISSLHFEFLQSTWPAIFAPFDDFVLSYRVGAAKPEAQIYHAALQAAQRSPRECVFIDDMLENVHAARQFGIDAFQFVGMRHCMNELIARKVL